MDAAHEVADVLQRRLGLLVGIGDHRSARLRVVMLELVPRRAQVGGEGDEALLGAVVEITLDAPTLRLGAVDGSRAARLQPGDLSGVGLTRRRPEQGTRQRQLGAGHADGHPRCDEHEPDDADQCGKPGSQVRSAARRSRTSPIRRAARRPRRA